MVTDIISGLALVVAAYSVWLARHSAQSEERREAKKRASEIKVACEERSSLGGPPIIGTTVPREHILTVRVINGGEAPEYVHSIILESQRPLPMTVSVREPKGTVEVRPRDQQTFDLPLDGHQAFAWDEPLRAVVRLANEQTFYSEYGTVGQPHHGQSVLIPDSEQVPDDQLHQVRFVPGERIAIARPPSDFVPPPPEDGNANSS
jgi:hypothetical protein